MTQAPRAPDLSFILAKMMNLVQSVFEAKSSREKAHLICHYLPEIIELKKVIFIDLAHEKAVSSNVDQQIAKTTVLGSAIKYLSQKYEHRLEPVVVLEDESLEHEYFREPQQKGQNANEVLWMPLLPKSDSHLKVVHYALWLEKPEGATWSEQEVEFLMRPSQLFYHAFVSQKQRFKRSFSWLKTLLIVALFLGISFFIPIRSSVIAPFKVEALAPRFEFAPLTGVVEHLHVVQGENVEKGDLLFEYDADAIEHQIEQALRQIELVLAEIVRLEGESFLDNAARAQIPVKKLELEKAKKNMQYLKEKKEISKVYASRSGMVILTNEQIEGLVINTGELVLKIADPQKTKAMIDVPVKQASMIRESAEVEFYFDAYPLKRFKGKVYRSDFAAKLSESNVPSIVMEASWENGVPDFVMPGLRGTSKLYGADTTLGLQLFRRPIFVLRSWVGF